MVEAILWDNDGVLVDTEEMFFAATCDAFARAGVTLPHSTSNAYWSTVGTSSIWLSSADGRRNKFARSARSATPIMRKDSDLALG